MNGRRQNCARVWVAFGGVMFAAAVAGCTPRPTAAPLTSSHAADANAQSMRMQQYILHQRSQQIRQRRAHR